MEGQQITDLERLERIFGKLHKDATAPDRATVRARGLCLTEICR